MLVKFSNILNTLVLLIAVNIFLVKIDVYVKVSLIFCYLIVCIFCLEFFVLKVRPLQVLFSLWFGSFFFFCHPACSVTSRESGFTLMYSVCLFHCLLIYTGFIKKTK